MDKSLLLRLQRILLPFSDACCWVSKVILILFILGMSGAILAQVFFRYVLLDPLMWPEDASKYMMVWVAFFGSGIAIREKGHVALTLLATNLPKKYQYFLSLAGLLIILGFLALFVIYGFSQAIKNPAISWNIGIQLKWPMLGLPIAGIFMIIHVLYIMVEQIISGKADFGQGQMEGPTV
jgi:TRAP-type transport system small permease protein